METMREVAAGLWVSGLVEAREWAGAVDLVIDCLDRYGPTGRTNHAWTPDDLDRIVGVVRGCEGDVLIHCRSGKSRSATAAAAVILDRGLASSPKAAMDMARLGSRRMNSQSIGGLNRWWARRQAARQTPLFG